nr:hypothetical protein [Myxococcus xanthus]
MGLRRRADHLGKRGDGGRGEERGERKLDAEGGADASCEASGAEGVSAEREEVVVAREGGEAEDLAEELSEELLDVALRRKRGGRVVGGEREGGEGAAVDFAVGRGGEGVEGEEARGHQGCREREGERGEEGVGGEAGEEGDEGDEADVGGVGRGERKDGGLTDAGEEGEGGLDFLGLDADAAHLHLEVSASEVGESAVGIPADAVAGAVEAGAGVEEKASGTKRSAVR